MRYAAAAFCLVSLSPGPAVAKPAGMVLTFSVGAVERKAPMRLYGPADKPALFGVEIATPVSEHVAIGVDFAGGMSGGGDDRRSLAAVACTVLVQSAPRARVRAIAGIGAGMRMEGDGFPPMSGTSSMLLLRGRVGAGVDVTRRIFVRPELVIDVAPSLDSMAIARVGIGYRF